MHRPRYYAFHSREAFRLAAGARAALPPAKKHEIVVRTRLDLCLETGLDLTAARRRYESGDGLFGSRVKPLIWTEWTLSDLDARQERRSQARRDFRTGRRTFSTAKPRTGTTSS